MKILFFIESLHSGGKERRFVELIKGLSKDRSNIMEVVLIKKGIHYKDIFSTNIKIHYIVRKGLKKDPRIFYKFFKIARNFKPDIIHVWGNMVAIYAIPAKVILKIPMINNQITNAPLKVSNSILSHKLHFPFSDRIIANSRAGLKAYNPPGVKSSFIYNGFDFKRIENLEDKDVIRNRFLIKTKYVVAMVASFIENKDYTTYIKAALELLKQNREITFLCVGAGDFKDFQQMIDHENLNNVLFLGRQKNIESIMNISDIGILISNDKKHGEGISNALMEFMALSKPVIANNCGGTNELISNNKNGFLIKSEDYKDLKSKISLLLKDDVLRKEFGKESRLIIEKNFSIDNMIDLFIKEYELLTNK